MILESQFKDQLRSINELTERKGRHSTVQSKIEDGGAEGDRTPDLMTASHALSQLSYGPIRVDDGW